MPQPWELLKLFEDIPSSGPPHLRAIHPLVAHARLTVKRRLDL